MSSFGAISSVYDALVLEPGKVTEIDQKGELKAGGIQIIERLGSMHVDEALQSLEFNDDLPVTDEVGLERLNQQVTLVLKLNLGLRNEGDTL